MFFCFFIFLVWWILFSVNFLFIFFLYIFCFLRILFYERDRTHLACFILLVFDWYDIKFIKTLEFIFTIHWSLKQEFPRRSLWLYHCFQNDLVFQPKDNSNINLVISNHELCVQWTTQRFEHRSISLVYGMELEIINGLTYIFTISYSFGRNEAAQI